MDKVKKEHRHEREMDRDVNGMILVVNDRVLSGEREDAAGPMARERLEAFRVHCPPPVVLAETEADVRREIAAALKAGARFVLTIGGTGVAAKNVVPEVTADVCEVLMEGLAQQIRAVGLENTALSSLSRGTVGITSRNSSGALVVNAPSSRGGVKDALAVVGPLLPHIYAQLDEA